MLGLLHSGFSLVSSREQSCKEGNGRLMPTNSTDLQGSDGAGVTVGQPMSWPDFFLFRQQETGGSKAITVVPSFPFVLLFNRPHFIVSLQKNSWFLNMRNCSQASSVIIIVILIVTTEQFFWVALKGSSRDAFLRMCGCFWRLFLCILSPDRCFWTTHSLPCPSH